MEEIIKQKNELIENLKDIVKQKNEQIEKMKNENNLLKQNRLLQIDKVENDKMGKYNFVYINPEGLDKYFNHVNINGFLYFVEYRDDVPQGKILMNKIQRDQSNLINDTGFVNLQKQGKMMQFPCDQKQNEISFHIQKYPDVLIFLEDDRKRLIIKKLIKKYFSCTFLMGGQKILLIDDEKIMGSYSKYLLTVLTPNNEPLFLNNDTEILLTTDKNEKY